MLASPPPAPSNGTPRAAILAHVSSWVAHIVAWSCAHARLVTAIGLVLGALAIADASQTFEIRTDLDSLISSKLPWRAEAARLEREFPSEGEDVVVVVDADTPERAERAAAILDAQLTPQRDLFTSVARANGGAFFDREALLFLDVDEVRKTTAALVAAQPLLGPLAADPSLRGFLTALNGALAGDDPAHRAQLRGPIGAVNAVLADLARGKQGHLAWRGLISGVDEAPATWRQYIETVPKLDYADAAPAAKSIASIRRVAAAYSLTPEHGVRIRVTGSAAISDDELATLQETTGPIALLMFVCMIAILYLAVRSPKIIFAILLTVAVGAVVTSAVGLRIYGRFNLISVAFLPLFVGLAIDFAIQFCVRMRAKCTLEATLQRTLPKAALAVGAGLALAAAATAAGFFAFLPTSYRGVSELGMIAGLGMVIAFVLTITLLPALLILMGARTDARETQVPIFAAADRFAVHRHVGILAVAALLAVGAGFFIAQLQFDFDPMRLRDPKTESMATYLELARSPDTTPNTLNILAPDLAAARRLAQRIGRLSGVADAVTLESFIPADQAAKLTLIGDARNILDFSLNPFEVARPASDDELIAGLRETAVNVRAAYQDADGADQKAALVLANALDRLAQGPADARAQASDALTDGFPTALAQINASLAAEPVGLQSLPDDLRRQWVSPQGHARIEVFPARQLGTAEDTTRFVNAVAAVAPKVTGDAVTIVESGRTILTAFLEAGLLSAAAIILLLFLALRRTLWVAMTIGPVILSGLLTFATCAILHQAVNLENMIALPLLLGIGVAFNIYYVVAWRAGAAESAQTSLGRAILFSGLTTGTSFAALSFSAHPGTASLGALLIIALFWILVTTLYVTPAALATFAPAPRPGPNAAFPQPAQSS